jgi:hypothetical protein
MDIKNIIILIIVLFVFSNKLLGFFWDIGIGLFYLIVILYLINLISPNLANTINQYISKLLDINSHQDIIKDVSTNVKNMIDTSSNIFSNKRNISSTSAYRNIIDPTPENRNFDAEQKTSNRNLTK